MDRVREQKLLHLHGSCHDLIHYRVTRKLLMGGAYRAGPCGQRAPGMLMHNVGHQRWSHRKRGIQYLLHR